MGDGDCSGLSLETNADIVMLEENLPIVNARIDFVKAMQCKRSPIHLQVLPPKVPSSNAEKLQVPDSYSACGLLMYDEEALGIFILPYKHAYHIYCFANLVGREEKCLATGCDHLIPNNIKELMFIDSGGDTFVGGLKFGKQKNFLLYIWYLRMCIVHVHCYVVKTMWCPFLICTGWLPIAEGATTQNLLVTYADFR